MYLLLFFAFCFSVVSCFFIRKYAIAHSLMDVPNDRSSHIAPTPRGGGFAIVLTFCVSTFLMWFYLGHSGKEILILLLPSVLIAFVGFWDDHGDLSPKIRLLFHFSASIIFLFGVSVMQQIESGSIIVTTILLILALFYLVWFINLYNFMDGINGIATLQAISIFAALGLFFVLGGHDTLAILAFLLVAASLGFLVWNFPSAKLFMGDGGSGFLGFIIAAFAVSSISVDLKYFWIFNIMAMIFICDSTVTLMKRFIAGEAVLKAHKNHAYQIASRLTGTHYSVSTMVFAINCCWLFPVSYAVYVELVGGIVGVSIAAVPIIILVHLLHKKKIDVLN